MAILKRIVPLVLLGAGTGCELPSTPLTYSHRSYSLHAVLGAGDTEARIAIAEFDPVAGASRPAEGAVVRLTSGADTMHLAAGRPGVRCTESPEPEADAACYSGVLSRPFQVGEEWHLLVVLPDGTAATGRTRVLGEPVLLAPDSLARIGIRNRGNPQFPTPLARVRFQLAPDQRRGDWSVLTSALVAFHADSTLTNVSCDPGLRFHTGPTENNPLPLPVTDELSWGIFSTVCSRGAAVIPWDSIHARVKVTAFDTTYSRYARQVQFDPASRPARGSAGMEGAYGVFASLATASRDVTFVSLP